MKTIFRLTALLALSVCMCFAQGTGGGTIIETQNGGVTNGTFKRFFVLNCVSGLTCSVSGSTLSITVTGGTGTVTHTAGNLTLNNFVLGNGTADIKDAGFSVVPPANGGVANVSSAGFGYFWGGVGQETIGGNVAANAVSISGANVVDVYQFVLQHAVTVGHITINETNAAGSSATCDEGIMDTSGNLLISSNGGFNCNASTGAQTKTTTPASLTLNPGVYYFACTASTATTLLLRVLQLDAGALNITGILNNQTQKKAGTCANAATAGILPAACGAITAVNLSSIHAVLFEP